LRTDCQQSQSSKIRESYSEEPYPILKPLEVTSSSDMIYNILLFLDASPLTLLVGAPDKPDEWIKFFEGTLAHFLNYLITDDERIRHMTCTVARKLMTEGTIAIHRRIEAAEVGVFKQTFWKTSSVSAPLSSYFHFQLVSSRSSRGSG
jgi:neurofibromin 1